HGADLHRPTHRRPRRSRRRAGATRNLARRDRTAARVRRHADVHHAPARRVRSDPAVRRRQPRHLRAPAREHRGPLANRHPRRGSGGPPPPGRCHPARGGPRARRRRRPPVRRRALSERRRRPRLRWRLRTAPARSAAGPELRSRASRLFPGRHCKAASMSRTAAPPRTAWLVALLCTAAAVAARMVLTPWLGEPRPFLPHLAATGIAAWYAGPLAGWIALVAGALAGELLVIGPRGSVRVADVPQLLGLAVYGAAGAAWILTLRSV